MSHLHALQCGCTSFQTTLCAAPSYLVETVGCIYTPDPTKRYLRTSQQLSSLSCFPKKSCSIRITINCQKPNKVTELPQIAILRVDGWVFSVFDSYSGLTQLTIRPDTIPLTAFYTPNGHYEWLRTPQVAARAPAWFLLVIKLVTAGAENIQMYLDGAIDSEDCLIHHVAALTIFFARLRLHTIKLSPEKSMIVAARVDFLGLVISADSVRT